MAVRKPLEKTKSTSVSIDDLIDKGAKVKEDFISEKKWTNINLRLPVNLLEEIDKCVEKRIGITRTGWILEKIHQSLKDD